MPGSARAASSRSRSLADARRVLVVHDGQPRQPDGLGVRLPPVLAGRQRRRERRLAVSDLRADSRTPRDEFGPTRIQEVFRFPYPAGAAVALAPLGALDFNVAAAIWGCFSSRRSSARSGFSACATGACSQSSSARTRSSLPSGSARSRRCCCSSRRSPGAGATGAGSRAARWRPRSSLKLFLWPLLVWLLATRRFAAAAIAAGSRLRRPSVPGPSSGSRGLTDYPELLRRLTDLVETVGLSLVALGDQAGLPAGVARALPFVVGVPLLVAVFVVARRDDGDRRAFSLAVIAAIAITPIVWLHYFTLLVAPLALARPRLAWPWALHVGRSGSFRHRGTKATSGGSLSPSFSRQFSLALVFVDH